MAVALREKLDVKAPQELVEYLNFFVYGESGVGKTTLAGTAQDHEDSSPVLILDVEGGMTTLRKRKDIDVIPVRSMDKIVEVHNELHLDTSGYYKTVIIDSLTELQSLDMKEIMKKAYDARPDKVDIDVPSQREWGKSREHIRRIVRAFKDLPMHTIMTALVVSEKDEGEPSRFYPSLPGKLRGDVPGFMDVVGFMQAIQNGDSITRVCQFAKTRRVVAKDRTDALGDKIENPSIPLMLTMIKESS